MSSQEKQGRKRQRKPTNGSSTKLSVPPEPKVQVPEVLKIGITKQVYDNIKERTLKTFTPIARGHVENFFEFIINVKPIDVMDAIEYGETLRQKYDKASLGIRVNIAMARGVLKASSRLRRQLKDAVTVPLIKNILKFENPDVYAVVERYGDKGQKCIEEWARDALEIMGVK